MYPDRDDAVRLMEEYSRNKRMRGAQYSMGHVKNAACAAYKIAKSVSGMDPELAYVCGMLHDIGRLVVYDDNGELSEFDQHRHPVEGYRILKSLGYDKQARIAITHGFPGGKNLFSDIYSDEDKNLVDMVLSSPFDDYDKLIQLTDKLSRLNGLCPLETRYLQIIFNYGWDNNSIDNWKVLYSLKKYFDMRTGKNIYSLIFDNVGDILFF